MSKRKRRPLCAALLARLLQEDDIVVHELLVNLLRG